MGQHAHGYPGWWEFQRGLSDRGSAKSSGLGSCFCLDLWLVNIWVKSSHESATVGLCDGNFLFLGWQVAAQSPCVSYVLRHASSMKSLARSTYLTLLGNIPHTQVSSFPSFILFPQPHPRLLVTFCPTLILVLDPILFRSFHLMIHSQLESDYEKTPSNWEISLLCLMIRMLLKSPIRKWGSKGKYSYPILSTVMAKGGKNSLTSLLKEAESFLLWWIGGGAPVPGTSWQPWLAMASAQSGVVPCLVTPPCSSASLLLVTRPRDLLWPMA